MTDAPALPDPPPTAGTGLDGLRIIAIATALAGLGGYVITTVVAASLGAGYALFAVFWSALYLVIGALAGVQQEVTRATDPDFVAGPAGPTRRARASRLALLIAAAVTVLVAASTFVWAPAVFGSAAAGLAPPLVFGAAASIFVATATGVMYGIRLWRPLAMVIFLDVALRLVAIVIGLIAGLDIVGLAWATVVPLPLVLGILWLVARRRLRSAPPLDVGYRGAVQNVARTIAAASATAVLVSGFPLFLGASSPGAPALTLSAIIFALTLTRAPLVVSTIALQSYLVLFFRARPERVVGPLVTLLLGIAGVGAVLALAAWWFGVPVIVLLAGEEFRLSPLFLGLLVLSSIPTAWLAVSGAAVLASSRHSAFAAGWILAAVVGVGALYFAAAVDGIGIHARVLLALVLGPVTGLATHLLVIMRRRG